MSYNQKGIPRLNVALPSHPSATLKPITDHPSYNPAPKPQHARRFKSWVYRLVLPDGDHIYLLRNRNCEMLLILRPSLRLVVHFLTVFNQQGYISYVEHPSSFTPERFPVGTYVFSQPVYSINQLDDALEAIHKQIADGLTPCARFLDSTGAFDFRPNFAPAGRLPSYTPKKPSISISANPNAIKHPQGPGPKRGPRLNLKGN